MCHGHCHCLCNCKEQVIVIVIVFLLLIVCMTIDQGCHQPVPVEAVGRVQGLAGHALPLRNVELDTATVTCHVSRGQGSYQHSASCQCSPFLETGSRANFEQL